MEQVIELCNKYHIQYSFENRMCHATGIGDILFRLVCFNNNLINEPFYINLMYFTRPYYMTEPINQLEFRFLLINDILKYNNMKKDIIKFVFSNCYDIDQNMPYNLIENFNLKISHAGPPRQLGTLGVTPYTSPTIITIRDTVTDTVIDINSNEYIIFHTKCRHYNGEDYGFLKDSIKTFCKNNKLKYKIIIMGERVFPHTEEVDMHGITTVYNELLELKNNNVIIDISIENIYNNLDYNNYISDIKIIENAKYNICFGLGGQLCTSTIFGNSTIVYCNLSDILNTSNFKVNNFYCKTICEFFDLIKEKCGNE